METRQKVYLTASFLAGVLICLGFKDIYSDLERRYWRRFGARKLVASSRLSKDERIDLQDNEDPSQCQDRSGIWEGLEACVGNTPLFRVKSLSDATGCEILAKAEVSKRPCISLHPSPSLPS